jgi:hypothetical protein
MNERRTFWDWLMDLLLRLGLVKPDPQGCKQQDCHEDADRLGWCWDHIPEALEDSEDGEEDPVR